MMTLVGQLPAKSISLDNQLLQAHVYVLGLVPSQVAISKSAYYRKGRIKPLKRFLQAFIGEQGVVKSILCRAAKADHIRRYIK